jgi:hypothetical protein
VAEVLPLPPQMRLIKGRKVRREQLRDEERFQFPAIQETWEVSCALHEELEEQGPGKRKADTKAGLYDIAS